MSFEGGSSEPKSELPLHEISREDIVVNFRDTTSEKKFTEAEVPRSVRDIQPLFIQEQVKHELDKLKRHTRPYEIPARNLEEAAVEEVGEIYETKYQDPLTKLWNGEYLREMLKTEITQELSADGRGSFEHVALVSIDVNGLKAINDLAGHEAGNEFLRRAGSALMESETLSELSSHGVRITRARSGGDEFYVLISAPADLLENINDGSTNKLRDWDHFWMDVRVNLGAELSRIPASDLVTGKHISKILPDASPESRFQPSASIDLATLEEALEQPVEQKNIIGGHDDAERIAVKLSGALLNKSDQRMGAYKKFTKRLMREEGSPEEQLFMKIIARTEEQRALEDEVVTMRKNFEEIKKRLAELEAK